MGRRLYIILLTIILLGTIVTPFVMPVYAKPKPKHKGFYRFSALFENGRLKIRHRSGDTLVFPRFSFDTVVREDVDNYYYRLVAENDFVKIVFHVKSYDPRIKFDVIAKKDINLRSLVGTLKRFEKYGKWTIDWHPLDKKYVLKKGEKIDPLISYDESTGTYVFDSPDDFAPCILVNSPSDGSVILKTPDGWYSGTILPDWAVLTHCSWTHNTDEKYYEFEFVVENREEEHGDVYVLYDDCLLYTSPSPRDRG